MLLLAECAADEAAVISALVGAGGVGWYSPPVVASGRVKVFTRLPAGSVLEHFATGNGRLTIREIRRSGRESFFLAAVHLVAKSGGWTDHSQSSAARNIVDAIERTENLFGITRTVLIGDLNMPPFAPGMVDGSVFHAHLSLRLAEQKSERIVDGERCRRTFFNPMWRFMTDRGSRPPGTYYWKQTVTDNHFWYTLDQVLVRPELAAKLLHIEIVETDGARALLTRNGFPDGDNASDHLPILTIFDL